MYRATSRYSSASRRRSALAASASVAALTACSRVSSKALRRPAEETVEMDVAAEIDVSEDANE
jgi:hypothetical protein